MTDEINWGPTGELVYNRTYSRTKPDGSKESWPETVRRVVDGNLALVDARHHLPNERDDLIKTITEFKLLPAGRHLWASGVGGAQHLFNCWVSGWTDKPSDHFEFTFLRLMEGGGVGANYSVITEHDYPAVKQDLLVDIVCDPSHPDYEVMVESGVLSNRYHPDWAGSYQIEDSREGWAAALVDLIDTHYRDEVAHFHRVYDVSRVREAGARLRTFGGTASGPLPLAQMLLEVNSILSKLAYKYTAMTGMDAMDIDHAIAQCVVAGGVRRSARMSIMHWSDPQLEEFLTCKASGLNHWTTNISVEVDGEFWKAARTPEHRQIMDAIADGMVNNGEPGFWDSSLSNVGEPNKVRCTNPCGEIALEAWEPCNLGHINLAAFVTPEGRIEWGEMYRAHKLMARFLVRATFAPVSDPKSREVLDRNRRIGVGHLGVQSFLALAGMKYSDAAVSDAFADDLATLKWLVRKAAADISHDLRIPAPVKATTVAPTGTVAKMPGVSEGIHPIFSRYFNRRIRFSEIGDSEQWTELWKKGYHVESCQYAANTVVVTIPTKDSLLEQTANIYGDVKADSLVEAANDLSLEQMLSFQSLYQENWADNAVSFTANVPQATSPGAVADLLLKFSGRLKGATIFPEASMPQAPYERITKEKYDASQVKDISDGVDDECSTGACPVR